MELNSTDQFCKLLGKQLSMQQEICQSSCMAYRCYDRNWTCYGISYFFTIIYALLLAYSPPKSCIPSRAKMSMNKNSKNSKEMILRIEPISDTTRFFMSVQYLDSVRKFVFVANASVCKYILCDFKNTQKSQRPHHWKTKWIVWIILIPDDLE